jgi:AcrR family transcriptional regulator
MAIGRSVTRAGQRSQLLDAAIDTLESGGPEAVQARVLGARIGASAQAVYTLFGGMPGVFEALVIEGLARLAEHVAAVPETDDPVADHFSKGWAYCDWAVAHPQLYRAMFGLTGPDLRLRARLEISGHGMVDFPEGRAALRIMVDSVERVISSGRIHPVDPLLAARQFLSATHGHVLLQIAGAFGGPEEGLLVLAALALNLMVGLGDTRSAAQDSLRATLVARTDPPRAARLTDSAADPPEVDRHVG